MRKVYIQLLFVALLGIACCESKSNTENLEIFAAAKIDTITFEHSLKGWELYTWPVGIQWKYSVLVGTNTPKTLQQVIGNPIGVIGMDSIKMVIGRMPTNEELLWVGPKWIENCWGLGRLYGNLQLPPKNIIIELKEYCHKRGIKLWVEE